MGQGAGRKLPARSRRRHSFLFYALASVGTFAMAGRAVQWLDGPVWLALTCAGVGLALAGYYLARAVLGRRTKGGAPRRR